MTAISNTDTVPPHRWLRVVLVLIAALEFLDALSGVQNIFTDYHHPTAFLRFAQTLTSIKLALAPVIAGAALIYAALGNVRHAILAGGRPRDRDLAPGGCLVDPDPWTQAVGRLRRHACILPSLRISGRRARRRGTGFQGPAASAKPACWSACRRL